MSSAPTAVEVTSTGARRRIADNTGKRMSKRLSATSRSTVILSYRPQEAEGLRALAQSVTLAGDTHPSLSLLSRRGLQLYCARLRRVQAQDPGAYAAEVRALESLMAPRSAPKAKPNGNP
jgi:hypothetical protein